MNELKIKIIEVKDVTLEDGKKFKAYKTVDKKGKKMDVRFTRDVHNLPTEACTIVVSPDKCNVATNRVYPILWVQEIIRIEGTERRPSNVFDYFDNEYDTTEGVPL